LHIPESDLQWIISAYALSSVSAFSSRLMTWQLTDE
jgi:hypothetical protein